MEENNHANTLLGSIWPQLSLNYYTKKKINIWGEKIGFSIALVYNLKILGGWGRKELI